MTEKELRKLKRFQLLELLIMQTKETEELKRQLTEQQAREAERDIRIANLGSVAEAAMEVHGVFAAAQAAADEYLKAAQKQAADIVADAQRQAADIRHRAHNEMECAAIIKERFNQ